MKVLVVFTICIAAVVGVTSPITEIALREYMAKSHHRGSQRRLMQTGYHRRRPTNRNYGKIISMGSLMQQLERAQKATDTFARMKNIVESYKP